MVTWAKFIYPTAGPFFNPTGNGSFSANAVDPTPQVQKFNEFSVRLDQTFGAKDSAWFRYSFSNSTLTQSAGLPSLPSSLIINSRNFGGSGSMSSAPRASRSSKARTPSARQRRQRI